MKTSLQKVLGYTRMQRLGMICLAILVLLVQLICCFSDFAPETSPVPDLSWLALQAEVDSLKTARAESKPRIYPFNPNFITDYKGYKLGMSVDEIDKLHAFREKGLFVNSASEFQQVTGISDSLLAKISPYFKFPDWVSKRNNPNWENFPKNKDSNLPKIDINLATKEELMAIYGIGNALSDRILKHRESLGGYVSVGQVSDVWGLSDEVVGKVKKRFDVLQVPAVKKINVNQASLKELSAFPYFGYSSAKQILTLRTMNGRLQNCEDLVKNGIFTVENEKIIRLYLEF